ncbi:large exoprotein [Microbacterium amylolyticum]|uniref:Uncharacterized Zn finger protein (UPF0148 family) n=1 Tax=Microbacterium amylolyticum TaxID=936337 RepID=A0ABS4ZJ27_9MICO|nr:large exoprotein [Microbacterium amylolyticum]MBP2437291.1 uncharacterized Zn finger protein (UPF0148 family) [Microbacterium amylolyticum]
MGGPVLGGGAIVLVVAVLWLAYLVPSWQMKARYNAAERNAARLNQALRVLAETSEMPDEVRVELSRRDAAKQHRLVKKLQAEDDRLRVESDKLALERKKQQVEATRLERAIAVEEERRRLAALRADPRAVQARARRRVRLVATTLVTLGLTALVIGVWQIAAVGTWQWLVGGVVAVALGSAVLRRMAGVAANARARVAALSVAEQPARRGQSQLLNPEDRGWVPRTLPAPLTATAGSRAAEEVRAATAQEQMRQVAREEAARARIEAEQVASVANETSRFARMGHVDDAEIEAHVRGLIARRAAG